MNDESIPDYFELVGIGREATIPILLGALKTARAVTIPALSQRIRGMQGEERIKLQTERQHLQDALQVLSVPQSRAQHIQSLENLDKRKTLEHEAIARNYLNLWHIGFKGVSKESELHRKFHGSHKSVTVNRNNWAAQAWDLLERNPRLIQHPNIQYEIDFIMFLGGLEELPIQRLAGLIYRDICGLRDVFHHQHKNLPSLHQFIQSADKMASPTVMERWMLSIRQWAREFPSAQAEKDAYYATHIIPMLEKEDQKFKSSGHQQTETEFISPHAARPAPPSRSPQDRHPLQKS